MGSKFLRRLLPFAALLPLLNVTACAEDACSRANDLISNCASPDVTVPSLSQASMSLACSGTLECQSQCINEASCLEINALQCFNEVSCAPLNKSSVASPLAACIQQCQGVTSSGADGGS